VLDAPERVQYQQSSTTAVPRRKFNGETAIYLISCQKKKEKEKKNFLQVAL
jgi:hypothetical protein